MSSVEHPNPSVTGAAIAAITKNIHIRAGSCVASLHSPYRIAEEWSVIDNLSGGKAGVAFASGWQPNDFVIKPENWENRQSKMFDLADKLKSLWTGDKLNDTSPTGQKLELEIFPKLYHRLFRFGSLLLETLKLSVKPAKKRNPDASSGSGCKGTS